MPRWFPDDSDRWPVPTCGPDFVRGVDDAIGHDSPIALSRMVLARLHGIDILADTTDVMKQKAAALVRLVKLDESQISPYQPLPGEVGPYPAKSVLRYLALDILARSNLFSNVDDARAFLRDRFYHPRDDREALILSRMATNELSWVTRARASERNQTASLLRAWIADVRRRLQQAGDGPDARTSQAISLELVIARIEQLGAFGNDF
ncbi:MAG TPA: hypothetical protein VNO21_00255, partial [Polyangiaceae bacterium]|nr:hypothetical protein [Polyangiaceae bacterium]